MKKGVLLRIALCLLLLQQTAFAENTWDMAKSDQYGKKAGGMLGRGVVNAATCFVDILVQTVEGTKKGPPLLGTLTGLGGGIGCTALRATSGVLDVGTFWVPGFNGFPVSRSYSNCLEVQEEVLPAVQQPVYTSQPVAAPQPQLTPVTPVAPQPPVSQPESFTKPGDYKPQGESRNAMDYVKK